MESSASKLDSVFENLWREYTRSNPQAKSVYDLVLAREQQTDMSVTSLANDHIALRTFNIPRIGIEALAQHFRKIGYEYGGEYFFKEKKLYARHYQHADLTKPKIFISELQLEKCSPYIQETAHDCAKGITDAMVAKPEILWSGRAWKADHGTYKKLLNESEYAGWMYAFGFRSNHFTVAFNHLKSFKDLQTLNTFLRESGHPMNTSGGEIKGTPAELLEQSSTLAEKIRLQFEDGSFEIPSCYYEFARRYANAKGEMYHGFIAASADKIFESTNVKT